MVWDANTVRIFSSACEKLVHNFFDPLQEFCEYMIYNALKLG